jgi:predicted phage terminase large subunit-like protein
MPHWAVVYEKAIRDDGSLFFPERLTQEFLDGARRTMGSYLYANQYQNEIIPDEEQKFKKEWIRYFTTLPNRVHRFAFIDPAISQAKTSDYTALVVVAVDQNRNWYVEVARRAKLNPSQIIDLAFETYEKYKPLIIGFEDVAFQQAILYFAHEEMKKRKKVIPLHGVKRGPDRTKEMRILALVPRFEWGSLFLKQGLYDLEMELSQFPRGSHDDTIDSLASLEEVIYYPSPLRGNHEPPSPNDPGYESWYIQQLTKRQPTITNEDD